jgi:hypothetical protein
MLQAFSKYGGVIQGLLGAVGTAAPGVLASTGIAQGGSVFNLLSGAALSYLGFKGTASQQQTGALGIGGLNVVVGILGAFGVHTIAGIPINEGAVGTVINLAIGAWGLVAGLMKKKAA